MKYSFVAILAASASAAPLNINLGAYSPALVVGDGEISFAGGGAAGAESLVNTLQGAAAASNGAVAQGQAVAPAGESLQQASVINEPVRSRSLGMLCPFLTAITNVFFFFFQTNRRLSPFQA